MVYNFKEYKPIFDTPLKREQEIAVARKIMDLLNNNKYESLEDFITKNNSYQNFLKDNSMDIVVKHFGNTLTEQDYTQILENLRVLTKTKQSFERENIRTANIGDREYNSFKGQDQTYFIDNSRTDKSIEDQMKGLQNSGQDFQTSDMRQNTENMFKELETKKEGFNLSYLTEINYDLLTNEEKIIFGIAVDYQQSINELIRVDLKKGIIVDKEDNIMKIEKENGEFHIVGDENAEKTKTEEKSYQKVITPTNNSIYSN